MQSDSRTHYAIWTVVHLESPCKITIERGDRILSAAGNVYRAAYRNVDVDDHIMGLILESPHEGTNMFCGRTGVRVVYRPNTGEVFIYEDPIASLNARTRPWYTAAPQCAGQSLN